MGDGQSGGNVVIELPGEAQKRTEIPLDQWNAFMDTLGRSEIRQHFENGTYEAKAAYGTLAELKPVTA